MKLLREIFAGGLWGITHGLSVLVTMLLVWYAGFSIISVVVGGVLTVYWIQREAKARKTWHFSTWYLDSKLDAAVPALIWSVITLSIIKGVF